MPSFALDWKCVIVPIFRFCLTRDFIMKSIYTFVASRSHQSSECRMAATNLAEGSSSSDDDEVDFAAARLRRHVGSSCVCLSPGAMAGCLNLPSRPGNPVYGPRMQLYCRTGFHIGIFPSGRVKGIDRDLDDFALLEVSTISPDEVRIQGVESKLYLAMDRNGRLYGEVDINEGGTIFVASLMGYYNTYLSRKYAHLGWYVGIKKSGKPKRGSKTKWGQKAIQFLPRRLAL